MSYTTEIVREIYDDNEGVCLTVKPSADFPGNIMIFARTADAKDWFGDIRVDLQAEFMAKLGQALIDAAKEAQNEKV